MRKRSLVHAFFFTSSEHLDLGWLLVLIVTLAGVSGFLYQLVTTGHPSWYAWGFLSTSFLGVLIAAVPVAKARLLADGKNISLMTHTGKDADIG